MPAAGRGSSASVPMAPAASITSQPNSSIQWQKSRPTTCHIAEGKVRLLGITGLNRSPVLPGRPTVSESGLPGFETMVWFGLFAPAGTPQRIIDHLNSKVRATLAAESVKKAFEKLGIEVVGGGPEILAAKVQSEMQKWSKLVRERNIRIDQ